MNPNMQAHFTYAYGVDGTLFVTIRPEFLKQIKWWDTTSGGVPLELSFGGITKMNDWGNNVNLTIQRVPVEKPSTYPPQPR